MIVEVDPTTTLVVFFYVGSGSVPDATRLNVDIAVARVALSRPSQVRL